MNNNVLRSFASQFAQGIIYFMNSLGTEDEVFIAYIIYVMNTLGADGEF